MKHRLRVLWCIVTFRHRGHVNHNDDGIYWQCAHCPGRLLTHWRDIPRQYGGRA